MEQTIQGTPAVLIPSQRGASLLDSAVWYATDRNWEMCPGTWLEYEGGDYRCSCGSDTCRAPGAHPAHDDWLDRSSGSPQVLRRLWSGRPTASILLPTGRLFDAVDVPETSGFLALARMKRMGLVPGPVTRTPDRRMQFLALPGVAAEVPGMLRRLGCPPGSLDLRALGVGGWVAAPPTRFGRPVGGPVQWASLPTFVGHWLPDAEQLIPPLAYACARDLLLRPR